MLPFLHKKSTCLQNLFLATFFQQKIHIFFIDKCVLIPAKIKIKIQDKCVLFQGSLDPYNRNVVLYCIENCFFFLKKKQLLFLIQNEKEKKKFLSLYTALIKIKIKGLLQKYKMILIFKGIGFKSFIKKDFLILKVGYSHDIFINIPSQISILSQPNRLIFKSIDFIQLRQFVHFVKSHKKPEPYKGKGLLLKNEHILRKEGKKNKK